MNLFCARAPEEEIVKAWKSTLTLEESKDAIGATRNMRSAIVSSQRPEVRTDANNAWKFTAEVMRTADEAMGIRKVRPRPAFVCAAKSADAAPKAPKLVLAGTGEPGNIALWWSEFEVAADAARLKKAGITHRLNMAAELKGKLLQDEGLVTYDVPMEDVFSEDPDLRATWAYQLQHALEVLRGWREQGAVVNVNCQMGKNRSGAGLLIWLCCECGWSLKDGVEKLRAMNPMACANPHLIVALGDVVGEDGRMELNPAHNEGGWVCISPPGSPRAGVAPPATFEQLAAEAALKEAAKKLEALGGDSPRRRRGDDEDSDDSPYAGDMEDLFGELDDVD